MPAWAIEAILGLEFQQPNPAGVAAMDIACL
jgi:hypothetical protein